jgi:branched-chain amino acid transport system ATP-binding protein
MSEILLEVKGCTAGYGDVQVLWGIDLEVLKGEITCIVGSNGAGKSTLLRTLSGLVKIRSGSVTFAGKDLTGAMPAEVLSAGIAHVPEGRRLFKGLSVRDNLPITARLGEPTSSMTLSKFITSSRYSRRNATRTPPPCPVVSSRCARLVAELCRGPLC